MILMRQHAAKALTVHLIASELNVGKNVIGKKVTE